MLKTIVNLVLVNRPIDVPSYQLKGGQRSLMSETGVAGKHNELSAVGITKKK